MDFVRDTLADGRPYRIWALVDEATREAPLVLVDRSLPARRVVEALDTLLLVRGRPAAIGPGIRSRAASSRASTANCGTSASTRTTSSRSPKPRS